MTFRMPNWSALASLLFAAEGCGPSPLSAASAVPVTGVGSAAQGLARASNLSFQCVRRYTSMSSLQPVTLTESFVRNAKGQTKVRLIAMNGLAEADISDPTQLQEFQNVSELLDGGLGRYFAFARDFSVRSVDRFLANYTFQVIADDAFVAGRKCLAVSVTPHSSDRPSYTVWADAETFVTLRYVEYMPGGGVVAEMDTVTVDFEYDASNESFPVLPVTSQQVVSNQTAHAMVSFKVFEPKYLPAGFELISIQYAQIAGHPVLYWTYDDGVQLITIGQYAEIGGPEPVITGNAPDEPARVRLNLIGAQVRTWFVLDGTQIHVYGKVAHDEIQSIIESLEWTV